MNARPVSEIVAELPKSVRVNDTPRGNRYHYELHPAVRELADRALALDAARPICASCGGRGYTGRFDWAGEDDTDPCPAKCDHGKVPA